MKVSGLKLRDAFGRFARTGKAFKTHGGRIPKGRIGRAAITGRVAGGLAGGAAALGISSRIIRGRKGESKLKKALRYTNIGLAGALGATVGVKGGGGIAAIARKKAPRAGVLAKQFVKGIRIK